MKVNIVIKIPLLLWRYNCYLILKFSFSNTYNSMQILYIQLYSRKNVNVDIKVPYEIVLFVNAEGSP